MLLFLCLDAELSISEDSLNFTYVVVYLNRAPAIMFPQVQLPAIMEDLPASENRGSQVGGVAELIGTDSDDMEIGLAVTQSDQRNGVWQYRAENEFDWLDFPDTINEGYALQLNSTSWIRFIPNQHFFGMSQFTARLWDMTNENTNNGVVGVASNDEFSGPYSSASAVLSISVVHINDPPRIALAASKVTYTENSSAVQIFPDLNITDVDNTTLQSATLILECPDCSTETSSYVSANDVIFSQQTGMPFRMELISNDSLRIEFEVTPIAPEDRDIARFIQFLESLYFANADQEPMTEQRLVSLSVSDGINSSAVVMVAVAIQLVNDEVPFITLPYTDFTYTENSGLVQLFEPNGGPVVSDDDQIYTISSARIWLAEADLMLERIMVDCLAFSQLVCSSSNGTINITGEASISNYSQVLETLAYENSAEEPIADPPRVVALTVFDGRFTSPDSSFNILTELINDQLPIITPAASSVVFVEENPTSPSVAIALNLTVTDFDVGTFPVASIQAFLTDPVDDGEERIRLQRNLMFPRFVLIDSLDPNRVAVSVRENAVNMNGDPITGLPPNIVQRFLQGLRYSNRAVQPSGESRSVMVVVSDNFTLTGIQDSAPAVITINFELTDDLPVVELNAGVVLYLEGQSDLMVLITPNSTIQDVDNANISGLMIELVSQDGSDISREILRVTLPQDGSVVENQASLGNQQQILLNGIASVETYTSVLRSVTYEHSIRLGNPESGNRLVEVTPISLGGMLGVRDEVIIAFNATDSPPILDLNGPGPGLDGVATFIEESDPINLLPIDFVLRDVDSTDLEFVQITLSTNARDDMESIFIASESSGVTIEENGPSSIRIVGLPSPVADFRTLLLSLQYVNQEDEPSQGTRNVTIVASDGSGETEAIVYINIELVNDAPVILLNNSEPNFQVTFIENGPPVPLSSNPQVTDSDSLLIELRIRPVPSFSGDVISSEVDLYFNEAMGYYFTNFSSSLPTEVRQVVSTVVYTNNLDEPESGDRVFCFSVVDDQQLPSAEACSRVSLSFVNDNPPVFPQSLYMADVKENVASTDVIQVVATDADSTNTQFELTYRIASGDDCMVDMSSSGAGQLVEGSGSLLSISPLPCRFTIDRLSGQISTTDSPPDREVRSSYLLAVVVSDGTNEGRTYVNITIIDVNDVAPRFQPAFYSVTIPLGAPANLVLAQITVLDPDLNDNIMIFRETIDPPLNVFTVDTSGIVRLSIPENELDPAVPQYIITINALDSQFTPSSNLAVLEVNVILNNADPVFDVQAYSTSILETATLGSSVLLVSATDADTGSNAEITYSFGPDTSVPFSLNSTSGYITLESLLDFEVTQSYSFVVIATDGGRIRRSATAGVLVEVLNVNEDKPSFTQSEYLASVCEGVPIGYEILTVLAEDTDAGSFGEVTYRFVNEESSLGRIAVNENTGVVTVASPLDFEDQFMSFMVAIQAADGGGLFSTEAQVRIYILNDNEFQPAFQRSTFEVTIPENYPVGNPLPLVGISQSLASDGDACDVDQCEGSIVISNETCSGASGLTYSITGGNEDGLFAIDRATGTVYLANSLDFDVSRHRHFNLSLLVDDGQFVSTAELLVTITDLNDNLPVFGNSSYFIVIPENTAVNTSILTVEATDLDPTSVIVYSLAGEGFGDFFVGANSGVVSTANPLNFQTMSRYDLIVLATNPGASNTSTVAVNLTILITDVNNNPPIFSEPSYTFFLQENTNPGQIGAVFATDDDSGSNAIVRYSLNAVSPGNSSLFRVDPETGVVFALVEFDREEAKEYTLTVQAVDSGQVPLSASVQVLVVILDENDNAPVLTPALYFSSINEDVSTGTAVVAINATDPDASVSVLLFEIIGGNELGHYLVNETGVVYVASELDRELVENYTLTVQVSDSITMPLTSTATVFITLRDVNDNPPSFLLDNFTASISENLPVTSPFPVIKIEATDVDIGSNAIITYSLSTASTLFEIDGVSGLVSVSRPAGIDREVTSFYILEIVASNPDGLSSTALLVITILDVNDNSPVFTERTFLASIDEDFTPATSICDRFVPDEQSSLVGSGIGMELVNQFVTTVTATDRDEAGTNNSRIFYSLLSVSPPANFMIDQSTGEIFVAQSLDRECFETYNLVVEASNEGSPLRDTATVSITVTDVNDNSPTFNQTTYVVMVPEDIPSQTSFLLTVAVDPDSGINAELMYSLGPDSFPFEIEETSGRIYSSTTLDRETTPFYSFEVFVSDSGTPPRLANASVEVTILDVNDNPPQLSPSSLNLNLDENLPIGSVIANFTVTDPDIGSNASSELIVSAQGLSSFRILDESLVVSGPLDFETTPEFQFEVLARNVEPPHMVSSSSVVITLNNLNDNPPIVMFNTSVLLYFERNKRLPLDVNAVIVDDDGVDFTTLVDGIVEFMNTNPLDPSRPFTPNTRDLFIPYDCPLEDDKVSKFAPCNLAVFEDNIFTRRSRDLFLSNLEDKDIVGDTIVFDASEEQYAYKSIASILDGVGLTISTYIWFTPIPDGTAPLTIVSKASPTTLLYSLFCSPDGQDLRFQYRDVTGSREISFIGLCGQLQGAWYHLTVVLDNSDPSQWRVVVLVNGVYMGERDISVPVDVPGSVFVGTRPSSVNGPRRDFFNGRLHQLLFSYDIADQNEINCAIGCGAAIISILEKTPLSYRYNYTTRSLTIRGRQPVRVYEEFLNSLVLVLPLLEPISSSYSVSYTVQDDVFNCLPNNIRIVLQPVNDHQPTLSLSGDTPPAGSSNFTATFVEEAGPVPVVNRTGLFVRDGDLVAFTYTITVEILNPEPVGSGEVLEVVNVPEGMNVTYADYTLTLTGNLALPLFEGVLRTITYNNRDDEPVGDSRELLFTVSDPPEADVTGFSFVNIILVNDIPMLSFTFTLTEYTEGDGPVRFIESVGIDDSDNTTLVSGRITFNIQDPGAEILSVSTANSNIASTYDNVTGILTLNGEDVLASYSAVIQSLTYEHANMDDPSLGTRWFFITVSDGLSETNVSGPAAMLFFSAVNDPPVFDLNGPNMGLDYDVLFIEDTDSTIGAVSPAATIIDVDNFTLANVTITLTPTPDGVDETLILGTITGTELILGIDTPVNVFQPLLLSLQYQNLAEEPTPGVRIIEFVAHDGIDASLPAFTQITIQATNDIPLLDIDTNSAVPGYQTSFVEQGAPVFITSQNVSITDNDADAVITTVMVVIQNALDGLDERIMSTDSSVNITILPASTSLSFTISPSDGSLGAAEDLLTTLLYVNQREEPSLETRIISISVSDGASFSNTELVTLQVVSVNENAPQFEQPRYSRSIEEGLEPEVSVARVRAVDLDGGQDGAISYAIIGSNPVVGASHFRIDNSGILYTTVALDRESIDFYILNISASDGGNPPLVDYATVEIMVLDVNDLPPAFLPGTSFNLTVSENVQVGYVITTLGAIDGDLGESGVVSFSIGREGSLLFSVSLDGRIEVASPLDADIPNPVYFISIIVSDNGTVPMTTEANFTITVLDFNDNRPQFNVSRYFGVLPENSPPGTPILTVTATDMDSGTNALISYILRTFSEPPQPSTMFSIDVRTGVITNTVVLRLAGASIFLFVTATDNGTPTLSNLGIQLVQINITDVNDNAPRFSMDSYMATVDENVPIGSSVLQVAAVDDDMGNNAQIRYFIVPNSQVMPLFVGAPLFAIDAISGVISVNEMIDFELQSLIVFTVEARDMGSPALTGSATVNVTIRDLNDNKPQFNQSLYEVSVPENIAVGTTVLTVVAWDDDSNQNGALLYMLLDNTQTFVINQSTGAISNAEPLDFESDCFYQLLVTVSDNGVPMRNSTAMIHVTVLPIHDVPPMFSMSSYSRSLPENVPAGSSIQQVLATDGDITSCSELNMAGSGSGGGDILPTTEQPQVVNNFEYILLSHNDVFTIDNQTGLITNLVVLDREVASQYLLLVQARDPEGLTANANVTVTVLDRNDNIPMFSQGFYTMVVSENAPVGFTVIRVTATDRDSIDQGRLVYSLRDQMEFFTIDNRTGDIIVAGPINFEVVGNTITLIAIATDTASNSATAFVRLTVTDLNDVPPFISTQPSSLTFTEGQVTLAPFPNISIIDADSFQNLCSATVELSTPQTLNTAASECRCSNTSRISTCDLGCFEFIQVTPGSFPGAMVQSGNGTMLMLVGNHSIDTYTSAIQSIQYVNLISNPTPQPRTISIYVFDCQLPSNTLTNTINVQPLNVFPPIVDLNGPNEPGTNLSVTFRERGPRVSIASADAVITDEDMVREREELTGLDVWISNPQDSDSESLVVSPTLSHANITFGRNSAHSISFAGVALLSDYTAILARIFYANEEDEPTPSPVRLVNVVAHEFHLSSEPATTTIQFATSNDHPPVILTSPPRENRVTSFREGSVGAALTASDAFISDLDSTDDPIMELQVHVVSSSRYDLLFLADSVNVSSSITINAVSNSSILFSGIAPRAYYDAIIRGLSYQFTGDEFESLFPPKFVYLEVADSLYSTFSAVQISLTPVNDQVPVFSQSTFTADIFENATVGDSVVQVTASDGDRFSNNNIRYFITAGNEGNFFAISPENGTIYLNRPVDFEMMRVHRLIVTVNDLNFAGTPFPTPSTANVTINLRDVNDLVPMFSATEYNATVGESVPIGTPVLQVFASDGDSPPHSLLEFDLAGTADFVIDGNGVILTAREIDRERTPMYTFFVNVRNPGISAFDTARVTITVLNLNDNPPILILDPNINTLQEPETSIPLAFNLEITDRDPNPSLDYAIVQVLTSSNRSSALGELVSMVDSGAISVSGNGSSMLVFTGESRPLSEYIAVLRGIVYQDLSNEPLDMDREIAYQVGSNLLPGQPLQLQGGDGQMVSNVSIFTLVVGLINDNPPQLTLDSRPRDTVSLVLPECSAVLGSYSTEYVEDSLPIALSHSSLDISDNDSGENTIAYAVIEITNAQDRGLERLAINIPSSSQIAVLLSDDFRIVLSGSAPLQDYENALRSIV